ncbi:MAG: dihydropteroate synthase [Planctomycetales bacterium]|nr:dihydropteroate synthase [Planctomycetales bacterium]
MGIVNVTPDSFSDGGKFFTPSQAVEHALRLEDAGADILDIGGESTRPYSEPVSADEELRRVVPVIESLMARVALPLSIDTSKGRVAAAALQLGAEIVNDVTGLTGDESMLELVANSGAGVCVMHMQGTPQTMQESPSYGDVTSDIYSYLSQRDAALRDAGILPERICLDPGIGFGKTHEQNIQLVRECSHFLHLGRPILIGHSRKGFIGRLLGDSQLDRTAGSVAISLALAQRRIQVLRIHDVKETSQALACFAAVGGLLTGD